MCIVESLPASGTPNSTQVLNCAEAGCTLSVKVAFGPRGEFAGTRGTSGRCLISELKKKKTPLKSDTHFNILPL